MANTSALRKVQFGKEVTFGTSVAATGVLSGVEDFRVQPQIINTPKMYLDGTQSPFLKNVQTWKWGSATISGAVSPEDILYVLDSAVNADVITGVGPWTHTFLAPVTTTVQATNIRTLEFYDGNQGYKLTSGYVPAFSISAALPDVWKFASTWAGQQVTAAAPTAALSNRVFAEIPTASTSIWIDDIGGTVGTTAVTATLIGFTLNVATAQHMKTFLNGTITPSARSYGRLNGDLTVTLEANATGVAEIGKYLAGTGRLIRIKGTSGANSVQFDFAGDYQAAPNLWDDRDGNTIITLKLAPRYDSGAFANWLKFVVTNAVVASLIG